MCGIAGVLNLNGEPASPETLKRMTDAIAHRGPDGEGHFTDGALGLGHRRLAIIDLSPGGRQPMATRDGRYVITYNGEIYNFRELRKELEALGHAFTLAQRHRSAARGLGAVGPEGAGQIQRHVRLRAVG